MCQIQLTNILLMANSVALLNMFIPMASPERATNLVEAIVSCGFGEKLPDVKLSASHPGVDSLQPGKPARRVEMSLDRLKVGLVLYPTQGISSPVEKAMVIKGQSQKKMSPDHAGEPDHRSPSHSIVGDRGGHSTASQGAATSVCACHKTTLRGCHWNLHMSAVQIERSHHSNGDRHVADNIFTAGAHHLLIVVVLVWQLLQSAFQLSILAVDLPPNPGSSAWITQGLLEMGPLDLFLLNQLDDF